VNKQWDFVIEDSSKGTAKFKLTRFCDVTLDTSTTYLVRGLIPISGLIVVWGPPKCGKSFWTFDVMMHVTRGIFYRERRVQQGTVVYIALEGGKGFHYRIEAYKQQHGISDAPLYLITNRTDLVHDHSNLIASIKEATPDNPVAVVIDTLNRSLSGSESSDEDMASYIQAADAVREAFQCAVIIVHHCGVDGTRPRGHTSLTGAADAQIAVARDEASNDVIATIEWMKDGVEGDQIASRLQLVELGPNDDGDPITSCVILPTDVEGRTYQTLNTKVKGESKSLRVFRDAFDEALLVAGKLIHVRNDGPAVRAVNIEAVRTQFYLRWATGEGDATKRAEAQRKTFNRTLKTLSDREFPTWVDGDTEWIWKL
jgi:hypothetical protein